MKELQQAIAELQQINEPLTEKLDQLLGNKSGGIAHISHLACRLVDSYKNEGHTTLMKFLKKQTEGGMVRCQGT